MTVFIGQEAETAHKPINPKSQKPHEKPAVTFLLAEPVFVTFLVTLYGVAIAGVGSAFWGVAAGAFPLFVQQYGQERRAPWRERFKQP